MRQWKQLETSGGFYMSERKKLEQARREAEQSATAWFAVLDRAREAGDFERAAAAQRRLKQMGVIVRFDRKAVQDAR